MRELLTILLKREGYRVSSTADGHEAIEIVTRSRAQATGSGNGENGGGDPQGPPGPVDLVIQDLHMPAMPGIELLKRLKERWPDLPSIVITAFTTWDNTVEAMRLGAYDYVKKPFDTDDIRAAVSRALTRRRLLAEARSGSARRDVPELRDMIGNSKGMRETLEMVARVAPTESTILIEGESGTGKELVARAVHYGSTRAGEAFISVNCAAFPETLLESELFGHLKGTFTGAVSDKKGLFTIADRGTFFLDEVGELPLSTQVKLLRVLEERQFYPLGGTKPVKIDVRFVCATNRDLKDEVARKRFRDDLYYRLNVIPIHLPPLRERGGDIPLLAGYFVRKHSRQLGREVTGIAPAAQAKLAKYAWPGNVRELENVIQRAIALARGPVIEDVAIELDEGAVRFGEPSGAGAAGGPRFATSAANGVPVRTSFGSRAVPVGADFGSPAVGPHGRQAPATEAAYAPAGPAASAASAATAQRGVREAAATSTPFETPFNLEETLESIERRYVEEALARTDGNLTRAAQLLGVSFRSLRYRVKKLGLKG